MDRKTQLNPLSIAFLAGLFLILSSSSAFAAVRCESLYGGGETCVRTGELQIDKEICNPGKENGQYLSCNVDNGPFVDNLGPSDRNFTTNEEIVFKLKVKNVGDDTLFDIDVKDTLPTYLFLTGDSDTDFNIDKLNPGDSKEFIVKARVVAENQLPADKSLVCTVNTAEVNDNNDEHDKDTAQFCISKKVLGVTVLPKTGSDYLLIASIVTLISSITGLALAKIKA